MLTVQLVLLTALAVPFQDAQQRFNLDLPGGWEVGPLPPSAEGAAFRCTLEGKVALAAVRIFAHGGASKPAAVLRQVTEGFEREPGFRLVEEGSADLGGLAAARRRYVLYVDGKPELVKMVEDRVALSQESAFLVHVEALSSSFAAFEPDFNHLLASFRVGAERAELPQGAVSVVGKWLMKGTSDTFLELHPDSSFDLAGTPGTYRVQGNALLMWPTGGGMERFEWKLDRRELVLSSASLGEPIRYQQVGAEALAPLPGSAQALVGTWKGGGKTLVLRADGTAELNGKPYSYTVEPKRILLSDKTKPRGVLTYQMVGSDLRVSGKLVGKAVTLKRESPQP